MAEYINKEAFIAHEKRQMHEIHDLGILCGAQGCLNDLKKFPAADVRENVIRAQGDKLRNVSDDELAKFLNCVETDGRCGFLRGKHGWLDWLQQEVEHGESN